MVWVITICNCWIKENEIHVLIFGSVFAFVITGSNKLSYANMRFNSILM
jgi:hypothetical protein